MRQTVEFRILGPLEARRNGEPLALGQPKQRTLLALLLVHANRPVSLERIVDELWPEAPPASARHSIEVYVSGLRKSLGADRLLSQTPGYLLRVDAGELDADRLSVQVAQGKQALNAGRVARARSLFASALELFRGEPLNGVDDVAFARAEQMRLTELLLEAQELRVETELMLGRGVALVPELRALIEQHPERERLHGQLMLALYSGGRQEEALAVYRAAHRALADNFGLAPGPGLRELERRILAHDPALMPPRAPTPPSNLPAPLTPILGRERELHELGALVRVPGTRLVTITGAPGVGKTRLALAVAHELLDEFADGVVFCGLAPISDPAHVPSLLAGTMGVRDGGESQLAERLKQAFRNKELLLLLDNFEHVLEAGPFVVDLLTAAPNVTVVATSRIHLRLSGEHVRPLEPLAVPQPDEAGDVGRLAEVPAVMLFCQRARAINPSFELTPTNAAAVAEICAKLDGLPLAIELAAAQIHLLAPELLLDRLTQRLGMLGAGPRDVPARQQTLEATIAWSYDLLTADERDLFTSLAVFSGGFTPEAAEEVCAGQRAMLLSLLEKSLIRRDGQRLSMLETLHAYALERLSESTRAKVIGRKHAEYFVQLAAEASDLFRQGREDEWLRTLRAEDANLRRAAETALELGDVELALAAAWRFFHYWFLTGRSEEGRQITERIVALPGGAPSTRGCALVAVSEYARFQHDTQAARQWKKQAIELFREDDRAGLLAATLSDLADVLSREGAFERADVLLDEAIVLRRKQGDERALAHSLHVLAEVELRRGRVDAAREAIEEAERILRRDATGTSALAWAVSTHAEVCRRQGDLELARTLAVESVEFVAALDVPYVLGQCLEVLGAVSLDCGDAARAARLFGAGARLRDDAGAMAPLQPEAHAEAVERARAVLGDGSFTAAWDEGWALGAASR